MRCCAALAICLLLGLATGCGGGSSGGTLSGHPLAGTWTGRALGTLGLMELVVDEEGTITQILENGSPSTTWLGGDIDDGPELFQCAMTHNTLGTITAPWLPDEAREHGALVITLGGHVAMLLALERNAGNVPTYFNDDIVGSWAGRGMAYEPALLDFGAFGPVTAVCTDGNPDNLFFVSFSGNDFAGPFDTFAFGQWSGTANITGATVLAVMTPDKQFVTVQARPAGAPALEDLGFFGLRRQ